MINYNRLHELKEEIESIFFDLNDAHQNILDITEDGNCIDPEKMDEFYSICNEYDAEIQNLKAGFLTLKSKNKKMRSCLSETRLMKKLRVSKLESQISKEIGDEDLPF